MNRIILIMVAIGVFSVPSLAQWRLIPLDQLIQDSDLIIVGTLNGVSQNTQDGWDYGQGTILIDEVIWGATKAGNSLTLKGQNGSKLICPRIEHKNNQGIRGIWLLTVEVPGIVRADYPDRFVSLGDRTKVERSLMRNKVCLRAAKYAFEINEPAVFTLVFRNPTKSPVEFPGVEYTEGRLFVNAGVALTLQSSSESPQRITTPLPKRVIASRALRPIMVGPRQEFKVTVDLKKLFKVIPGERYSVRLTVKGHGRANNVPFYPELVASR